MQKLWGCLCRMSLSFTMYRKQKSRQTDNAAYLGALSGSVRRYPPDPWQERIILSQKRNDRTGFWNSERKPRIPIYTDVWESPDGNEGRAYICLHESKETGKDEGQERVVLGSAANRFKCMILATKMKKALLA